MLTITPIYAGLAAILFAVLSFRVSLVRFRLRVSYGDGGDRVLGKAIRLQGNSAEYLPIGLILVALAELSHGPAWVVHGLGLMLLIGRGLYIYGYGRTPMVLIARQAGMLTTYAMIALGGVFLLANSFF
jgi:uncharacterized protein